MLKGISVDIQSGQYIFAGYLVMVCVMCFTLKGFSQEIIRSERHYLSGTDNEHTVEWEFFCTDGRRSDEWSTIEVPSCWEQQGFGYYDYGRDYRTYGKGHEFSDEKGMYRYRFDVPTSWSEDVVYIVFEGSMTDTEVKINGSSAGPVHQGGFYRFRYPVSKLLKFGDENLLEVTVSKMSSNTSVNRAERFADYWIFGGIFRPVYLERFPDRFIDHVAVSANADGDYELHVECINPGEGTVLEAAILDAAGQTVSVVKQPATEKTTLAGKVSQPLTWSSEFPNLYRARLQLVDGDQVLFERTETFGFRTVEIRHGDGVYINDRKIKFKGVNRHCFWPESGRTLSRKIDRMDVELMKEMNMNSVRCSHYPPDKSFLELCDSLGLYVIDELAGWQNAYDSEVGAKLVRELVRRDVNHPSIVLWSNGNEGGTNPDLDDDFDLFDPSRRPVIHAHHRPGNDFNGIETNHYEKYYSTKSILEDSLIYIPTEFLHGQDDGGAAAGLYDFWELMWKSPRSGGGFLWALIDEGVVRTDLNGYIDVNRVNAPDGVLGPHREREGSVNALREIFSPVKFNIDVAGEDSDAELKVENRFAFTNIKECKFRVELVRFNKPSDRLAGHRIMHSSVIRGADIEPGESGDIDLKLPTGWSEQDALYVTVIDPHGRELLTVSRDIQKAEVRADRLVSGEENGETSCVRTDSSWILSTSGVSMHFNIVNGSLDHIDYENGLNPLLRNGPVLAGGDFEMTDMACSEVEDGHQLIIRYTGDLSAVTWTARTNDWYQLDYEYALEDKQPFMGVSFDLPESNIIGVKWLGDGPYRVWKNRMHGVRKDVWESMYNNTHTGSAPWQYPEFKGYFSDVNWIQFNMVEGKFLVVSPQEDLFVRLFDFYALSGPEPHPKLPLGDISFLDAIPPTGTKLATGMDTRTHELGPMSEWTEGRKMARTLYFYFGSNGE